jgi:methionyl-tRNA formyltransferase
MTDPLRILFFCGERSRWGRAFLAALLDNPRIRLSAVVLATDERWAAFRRALSGEEPPPLPPMQKAASTLRRTFTRRRQDPAALDGVLRRRSVPLVRCADANSAEALETIGRHEHGVVLAAAYPQIFRQPFLERFGPGAYNAHPSLLPRCRGAHPVFWAIASGETRSGGTIHVLTPELDSGDIAAQVPVEISETTTYDDLYRRLEGIVPELLDRFVSFVTDGGTPEPQDPDQATFFRNDRTIHRRVFWSELTATEIHRLVRAAHGTAFFMAGGRRIRLLDVAPRGENRNMTNGVRVPPGTVVDLEDGMPVVAAHPGFVVLRIFAAETGRRPSFRIGEVLR